MLKILQVSTQLNDISRLVDAMQATSIPAVGCRLVLWHCWGLDKPAGRLYLLDMLLCWDMQPWLLSHEQSANNPSAAPMCYRHNRLR